MKQYFCAWRGRIPDKNRDGVQFRRSVNVELNRPGNDLMWAMPRAGARIRCFPRAGQNEALIRSAI